jgi:HlyD family secretion protein
MFMQIVDPSSMIVNANINQVDSEALRIGMKAKIRFDAYPGLELPGRVYSIGAVPVAGRRANFMKEIKVRVKLDSSDPRVIPDLSASADVVLATEQQATLAPLNSIFKDSAGKPYVMVRDGEQFTRRPVTLGPASNLFVSVRSGLKAGEVVAVGEAAAVAERDGPSPPPSS